MMTFGIPLYKTRHGSYVPIMLPPTSHREPQVWRNDRWEAITVEQYDLYNTFFGGHA